MKSRHELLNEIKKTYSTNKYCIISIAISSWFVLQEHY